MSLLTCFYSLRLWNAQRNLNQALNNLTIGELVPGSLQGGLKVKQCAGHPLIARALTKTREECREEFARRLLAGQKPQATKVLACDTLHDNLISAIRGYRYLLQEARTKTAYLLARDHANLRFKTMEPEVLALHIDWSDPQWKMEDERDKDIPEVTAEKLRTERLTQLAAAKAEKAKLADERKEIAAKLKAVRKEQKAEQKAQAKAQRQEAKEALLRKKEAIKARFMYHEAPGHNPADETTSLLSHHSGRAKTLF